MICHKTLIINLTMPIMLSCMLLFCSCEDNKGYPEKVFLPANGSPTVVHGDESVLCFHFLNGDTYENATETIYNEDTSSITYVYKWLIVETGKESSFTLTAQPNTGISQRSIIISLDYYGEAPYGYIKITQGAMAK